MNEPLIIGPGSLNPQGELLEKACRRIDFLSEQVNYLLRELYRSTNGGHESFKRNPRLAEDTRRAIELESADRSREVKEQVPTPEFTREQIKRLNAEMEK